MKVESPAACLFSDDIILAYRYFSMPADIRSGEMPIYLFYERVGSQNLKAIIRDRLPEISKKVDFKNIDLLMSKNFIRKYLDSVLVRAFERGEIKTAPGEIAETVKSLPLLLLILRIISEQDYDRHSVEFLVDSILLPVFAVQ
jgi:hypothetical protein